jgi:hypothetical protein
VLVTFDGIDDGDGAEGEEGEGETGGGADVRERTGSRGTWVDANSLRRSGIFDA